MEEEPTEEEIRQIACGQVPEPKKVEPEQEDEPEMLISLSDLRDIEKDISTILNELIGLRQFEINVPMQFLNNELRHEPTSLSKVDFIAQFTNMGTYFGVRHNPFYDFSICYINTEMSSNHQMEHNFDLIITKINELKQVVRVLAFSARKTKKKSA
jgi:hypothetical protein